MTDCVFCKIRDGQIPSMRVYEDERTICFMDINPLNPGHCLVVSRAHASTIFDADEADLQAAIATAKRVAMALRETVKPDGLNLLQAAFTRFCPAAIVFGKIGLKSGPAFG